MTLQARLLVLLLWPISAMACAAPPTDAQIDRLLEVTHARQTIESMLPQIEVRQREVVAQMTAGKPLDTARQAMLDRILSKSAVRLRETLAWDRMLPIYRDLYRQSFTGEDLDAITAFYSSAAGQKVVAKMPALVQNVMAATQKLIVPVLQDMQRDIEAETSPPAATDPPSRPSSPTRG